MITIKMIMVVMVYNIDCPDSMVDKRMVLKMKMKMMMVLMVKMLMVIMYKLMV